MNNQEMKELLAEKFPGELTIEQLEAIKAQLASAPELQAALADNLQLDSQLVQALDQIQLPVDDLYRRTHIRPKPGYIAPLIGLLLCFAVVGITVCIVLNALGKKESSPSETASPSEAAATPGATADPDEVAAKPEEAGDEPPEPVADVDTPPSPPAAAPQGGFPRQIEAESFAKGNLEIDRETWGNAETAVVTTGSSRPSFATFNIEVAEAGEYKLRLRYASRDSRPLKLTVNEKTLDGYIAGDQSGGNSTENQKWFDVATIQLAAGENSLRLATGGNFPVLDKLEIDTIPSGKLTNPLAGVTPGKPGDEPQPGEGDNPDTPVQPPAPRVVHPWTATVDEANPPAFDEVAFKRFDVSRVLPRKEDLEKWFETLDGYDSQISQARTANGACAKIHGIVKLKAPWLDDSALKVTLDKHDHLRIHFFAGLEGVTLQYNLGRANHGWAAYRVTRKEAGDPLPSTYELTATDMGRSRATGMRYGGPVSLRYREGEILLTRGDIELLRAPLAQRPEDVYFHGDAEFHGIRFVRTADEPFAPPAELPVVVDIKKPAELDWKIRAETKQTRLDKLEDGSVRLHADNADDKSWAIAPLPAEGLHSFEFQLKDVTAGTAVFLSRQDGYVHDIIHFLSNKRGAVCASFTGNDSTVERDMPRLEEQLVTYVGKDPWVRIIYGIGSLRWWLSVDGVHWGEGYEMWHNLPGALSGFGIQHAGKAPNCGITLKRVVMREITPLTSMAAEDVYDRAKSFHEKENLGQWREAALKERPEDVEEDAWLTACAIRSLGGGCRQVLGRELRNFIFQSDAYKNLSFERKLETLAARALIDDGFHNYDALTRLSELFHDAARQAFDEGNAEAYSQMRRAMMQAPVYTNHHFKQHNESLIRQQLVMLMSRQRFQEAARFCQELEFFHQQRDINIVDWAQAIALRSLPRQPGEDSLPRLKEEWRHPYVEELNKKAYNVIAELRAILASDAHADAAQYIANLDPGAFEGLAPAGDDVDLLTSLPVMVRAAMTSNPPLREAMREKFAGIAMLRVRRAMTASDVPALESAAMQFQATPASAEALMWLGDRAMSSGWFARAEASYREAERDASVTLRTELAPRMRLAAAMQGREYGEAVTADVSFGDVNMTAGEFEALVKEMRERRPATSVSSQAVAVQQSLPQGELTAGKRFRMEGATGQDHSHEVTRHTRTFHADWANRQLAAVQEGDIAYIGNRFQITAFNLATGELKWRTQRLDGKEPRAQFWTFCKMTPCLAGDRIYTRLLNEESAVLACFEKDTGKLVWSGAAIAGEELVAGPLLIQDQLTGLAMQRDERGNGRLQLVTFDRGTGEIVLRRDLIAVRGAWWARHYCEATPLHDGLVAALGGVVLNCDLSGRVRWVRRQMTMPVEEEPAWVRQHFQAPLLHDGKLFVAQPGVRHVECVDAATGRSLWKAYYHDIQRIGGVLNGEKGESLLVQTSRGFEAISLRDGKQVWSHNTENPPLTSLLISKDSIQYVTPEHVRDKKAPKISWLTHDGEVTAQQVIKGIESDEPRTGPLLTSPAGKFWMPYVNGPQSNLLELIELKK